MSFSEDEVQKVAHLARLGIAPEEVAEYKSNLSNIMDMVDAMNQADTDDVTPMAHPLTAMSQRLREDEVTEHPNRDDFQARAPQTEAGLYLVPKVID